MDTMATRIYNWVTFHNADELNEEEQMVMTMMREYLYEHNMLKMSPIQNSEMLKSSMELYEESQEVREELWTWIATIIETQGEVV